MGHAKDLLIEWHEQEIQLEENLAEAEVELVNLRGGDASNAELRAQENRVQEILEELGSVKELLGRGGTARKIEALTKEVQFIEGQLEKWRDEVRGTGHLELRSASKVLLTFAGALIGITVTIGLGLKGNDTAMQGLYIQRAVGWAFASGLLGLAIPLFGLVLNLVASFGKPSVPQPHGVDGERPLKMPPRWLLPGLLWIHGILLTAQIGTWIIAMTDFIPLVFSL